MPALHIPKGGVITFTQRKWYGVTFPLSKGKEITYFKKVQGNFLLQIQKVASTFRKGAGLHALR
ncbi:MAG: hypothetical protein D6808_06995, partial [Candidatus Dadabacteria bacterium]